MGYRVSWGDEERITFVGANDGGSSAAELSGEFPSLTDRMLTALHRNAGRVRGLTRPTEPWPSEAGDLLPSQQHQLRTEARSHSRE
jgi:hypothetical protein